MYTNTNNQQTNSVITDAVTTASANITNEGQPTSPATDAGDQALVAEVNPQEQASIPINTERQPVDTNPTATDEETKVNDSQKAEKEKEGKNIPRPKTLISSAAMAKEFALSEEQFYAWLRKHDVLKKIHGKYLLNDKFAGYFFATNVAYTIRYPDGEIDLQSILMWTDLGVGFLSTLFENDRK